MPKSINNCELGGHIGNVTYYSGKNNGTNIAVFSIALNSSWKVKEELHKKTTWANCKTFKDKAMRFSNEIEKGDFIHVRGAYSSEEYTDKEGNKKTSNTFVVFEIITVIKKQDKHEDIGF